MKALVTGVTGFAGGHLAEHLLGEGDVVLGCGHHGDWPDATPPELRQRVRLLAWELGPAPAPRAVQREIEVFAPEVIYHLAAISHPPACGDVEPTAQALAVNVQGTEQVLALAAALPRPPRVLVVSSSWVYAPVSVGTPPVGEDFCLAPPRAYGKTKLAAEEAARRAGAAGLDVLVARAFQHAGPRQSGPFMLPQWVRQLVRGGTAPIRVYNCSTRIDLCDVRDMVRAYRLLAVQGERGGTYNVGSGVGWLTGEVLAILRRLAGPDREILEAEPGPRYDPLARVDRLVQTTHWQPRIPLEQTVADSLAWWRDRGDREQAEQGEETIA